MTKKKPQSIRWFVQPATVDLDLGDGYTVTVKRELTVGESMAVQQSLVKSVRANGTVEPDLAAIWKANTTAYIVDWNLTDEQGRRVPFTAAAVDNLAKPAWDRIEAAVKAHIEAQEVARGENPTGTISEPGLLSAG
jgi:hypothetical protein